MAQIYMYYSTIWELISHTLSILWRIEKKISIFYPCVRHTFFLRRFYDISCMDLEVGGWRRGPPPQHWKIKT